MLLSVIEKDDRSNNRKAIMSTNRSNRFDPSVKALIVICMIALAIGIATFEYMFDSEWWGYTDVATGHLASWFLGLIAMGFTGVVQFAAVVAINRARSRRTRMRYKPIRRAGSIR